VWKSLLKAKNPEGKKNKDDFFKPQAQKRQLKALSTLSEGLYPKQTRKWRKREGGGRIGELEKHASEQAGRIGGYASFLCDRFFPFPPVPMSTRGPAGPTSHIIGACSGGPPGIIPQHGTPAGTRARD